jgi:hypothetical protein
MTMSRRQSIENRIVLNLPDVLKHDLLQLRVHHLIRVMIEHVEIWILIIVCFDHYSSI